MQCKTTVAAKKPNAERWSLILTGYFCFCLFSILSANTGSCVENLDVHLGSTLDDLAALLQGNTSGDLGGKLVVVHEEKFEISNVVDDELKEVVGEHVASGLSGSVADAHQSAGASEATTHAVINTLRLTVGRLLYSSRSDKARQRKD